MVMYEIVLLINITSDFSKAIFLTAFTADNFIKITLKANIISMFSASNFKSSGNAAITTSGARTKFCNTLFVRRISTNGYATIFFTVVTTNLFTKGIDRFSFVIMVFAIIDINIYILVFRFIFKTKLITFNIVIGGLGLYPDFCS
jgi:hypothetical protein